MADCLVSAQRYIYIYVVCILDVTNKLISLGILEKENTGTNFSIGDVTSYAGRLSLQLSFIAAPRCAVRDSQQ